MTDGKHPHPTHAGPVATPIRLTSPVERDGHVAVLVNDVRTRFSIATQLKDAGFRVTAATTFGAVELLLGGDSGFDLLLTTQSVDETTQFGLPQLARSVRPELPILVLEQDSAAGEGLVEAARAAIGRWPLRDGDAISLH